MNESKRIRPEVNQIQLRLKQMKKNEEFMISIPIGQISVSEDDRTEEKEKTDRVVKSNMRREKQHGREEI